MSQSKDIVVVFHEDNTCEVVKVKDQSAQAVTTEAGMYTIEDMGKYMNLRGGNLVYVANLDMPARMEAENLRLLRRSAALKRIFEYDVKDKPDYFKYVPYIIIVLLILFK